MKQKHTLQWLSAVTGRAKGLVGLLVVVQTVLSVSSIAFAFVLRRMGNTFCSNMAKSGMNPKTLQYLMGHSDIGVTLNTYTHVQYDDVETEMKRVVNAE